MSKLRWISVKDSMPDAVERVYIVCKVPSPIKGEFLRYQTIAEYIPHMTIEEEEYMGEEFWGEGLYNEEEDKYYTKEGFYECQTEADTYFRVSEEVTHWMPLLELPEL